VKFSQRTMAFHARSGGGKLNVTPLIDVIMVLIIFYLIVGQLAVKDRVNVTLPATGTGTAQEGEMRALVISVAPASAQARESRDSRDSRDYIITIDDEAIADTTQLRDRLRENNAAARTVHLRADKDAPYSAVAPVIEACRSVGVASLKLVTLRASGGDNR
jgi:biopolymer transport protein ExbD